MQKQIHSEGLMPSALPATAAVRLLRPWRGRPAGAVISTLTYGVAELLVLRGIAAWHGGGAPATAPTAAPEAPPAPTVLPPAAPAKRARKGQP